MRETAQKIPTFLTTVVPVTGGCNMKPKMRGFDDDNYRRKRAKRRGNVFTLREKGKTDAEVLWSVSAGRALVMTIIVYQL